MPVGGIAGAGRGSVLVSRRSRICCDGKGVSRRGHTSVNRHNKITLQSRLPSHSYYVYLWTATGRVLANHRSEASLDRYTRERSRVSDQEEHAMGIKYPMVSMRQTENFVQSCRLARAWWSSSIASTHLIYIPKSGEGGEGYLKCTISNSCFRHASN